MLEAATNLEDTLYTDINGKTVVVPANCAVSQIEGENTVDNGLVIIDFNGNEWVWIEVPKKITEHANTDLEIEIALEKYTK